jgi:UPF0755 protein
LHPHHLQPKIYLFDIKTDWFGMRFFLSLLAFWMAACIIVGGGGALWVWSAYKGPGPAQDIKQVLVGRGDGVKTIADTLSNSGVISSKFVFMMAARATGKARLLKAGEYEFQPHMAMRDVLDKMAKGEVLVRQVTIPEGLTSWQVVQILQANDKLNGDITDIPAEGSLLPETYSFVRGDSRQSVIDHMKQAMTKTLAALWQARDQNIPLSSDAQAVTLASVVEKETGVASERPRIAGVFINRLQKNMPLQSDPTVIYALTQGKIEDKGQGPLGRRLLTADLDIESPYNTYKHPGLPSGPIANPGAASLAAVLKPEKNDYLYFVADGKGGHVFAATLEEHNRNVAEWRKLREQK